MLLLRSLGAMVAAAPFPNLSRSFLSWWDGADGPDADPALPSHDSRGPWGPTGVSRHALGKPCVGQAGCSRRRRGCRAPPNRAPIRAPIRGRDRPQSLCSSRKSHRGHGDPCSIRAPKEAAIPVFKPDPAPRRGSPFLGTEGTGDPCAESTCSRCGGHPAATVDVLGETPFSRAGALGPVGRRARGPAYLLPRCSRWQAPAAWAAPDACARRGRSARCSQRGQTHH